jgi:hypothetical protein
VDVRYIPCCVRFERCVLRPRAALLQRLTAVTVKRLRAQLVYRSTEKRAWLKTVTEFGPTSIVFTPTAQDVHKFTNEMLEGMVSTVDAVERIMENQKFKPYFPNQVRPCIVRCMLSGLDPISFVKACFSCASSWSFLSPSRAPCLN